MPACRSVRASAAWLTPQDNLGKLRSDVQRLEDDLALKTDDVKQIQQQLSTALATADEAERRSTDLEKQLRLAQTELSTARDALATAQTELSESRRQLADLTESREADTRADDSALKLDTLVGEHAHEVDHLHAETARLETELQQAQIESAALHTRLDDATSHASALASEHQLELASKDKINSTLEGQVRSLEATIVLLRRELETPLDESNERVRVAAKALAQRLAMEKANEAHRIKKQHDALQIGPLRCRCAPADVMQRTRS